MNYLRCEGTSTRSASGAPPQQVNWLTIHINDSSQVSPCLPWRFQNRHLERFSTHRILAFGLQ